MDKIVKAHSNVTSLKTSSDLNHIYINKGGKIIQNSQKLDIIYYSFTLTCLKKFVVDNGLNSR